MNKRVIYASLGIAMSLLVGCNTNNTNDTSSSVEQLESVSVESENFTLSAINKSENRKSVSGDFGELMIPESWVTDKSAEAEGIKRQTYVASSDEKELTCIELYELTDDGSGSQDKDIIAYMINSLYSLGLYEDSDNLSEFVEKYNAGEEITTDNLDYLARLKIEKRTLGEYEAYHIGTSTGCKNSIEVATGSSEQESNIIELRFEAFAIKVNGRIICIEAVCKDTEADYSALLDILSTYKLGE